MCDAGSWSASLLGFNGSAASLSVGNTTPRTSSASYSSLASLSSSNDIEIGSNNQAEPRIADYLIRLESVEFPTTGGNTAFGLFYPPHNPDYVPTPGDKPPLLVRCHGGPTASASSTLNLGIQYWTSRGIEKFGRFLQD